MGEEPTALQSLRLDRMRAMAYIFPGAASKPSRLQGLKLGLLNSEFQGVAGYRLGQYAAEVRRRRPVVGLLVKSLHRIVNRYLTHIEHVDISGEARIGPGLLLMHRHGVLIGGATIGRNCVLHQNVTIGQRVAGGDHAVPEIGDRVWIGPGAIITGGITIGDGAVISAGSVLSKSVPAGCLVAGNPARIVARDYDNSSLIGALV